MYYWECTVVYNSRKYARMWLLYIRSASCGLSQCDKQAVSCCCCRTGMVSSKGWDLLSESSQHSYYPLSKLQLLVYAWHCMLIIDRSACVYRQESPKCLYFDTRQLSLFLLSCRHTDLSPLASYTIIPLPEQTFSLHNLLRWQLLDEKVVLRLQSLWLVWLDLAELRGRVSPSGEESASLVSAVDSFTLISKTTLINMIPS